MISKLALGTVQFGLDYGISNVSGRMSYDHVQAILEEAWSAGVEILDTAYAYGDSEAVLGRYFKALTQRTFDVVAKMSPNQDSVTALDESLERLAVDRVYGYLLHDFSATRSGDWRPYEALRQEVERGRVQKAGFSVYHPEDLEFAMAKELEFELVQIPFSVFDQRFSALLPELRARGVEIHARSVFLQGLCFLSDEKLSGFFEPAKATVRSLRTLAKEWETSIASLCLKFILDNEDISRVVVGVNSIGDLRGNIQAASSDPLSVDECEQLKLLHIEDEAILLPMNWRKTK